MTPETFLDLLIPRWQSTLPERFTPDIVAGFVRRNRAALLQVVAQVMRGHRLTVAAKDPSDMTPDDHAVLERYSGWGGLSIERVKSTLPPDLVPETFGLIHEYYTPSAGQAEQGE